MGGRDDRPVAGACAAMSGAEAGAAHGVRTNAYTPARIHPLELGRPPAPRHAVHLGQHDAPGRPPHAFPVWSTWDGRALNFVTGERAQKARTIRHEPWVMIHAGDGDDIIIDVQV